MVKKFAAVTAACMLFLQNCYADTLIKAADTIYNKPDIVEFISADSIEGIEAEAYLNDEKLEITDFVKASETDIQTNYLFLVDESSSVSQLQIGKVKEALTQAVDSLTDKETMTIIAFGETIETRADHLTDKDSLKTAVATIKTGQGGTVLFDVIKHAAESGKTRVNERNVIFIISDGADFTVGGHNYEEVEKYVKDYGIIIYAVALGNADNPFISKFGQLARSSDGEMAACMLDTIDDNTLALMNKVRNSYALFMKSKNNRVDTNGEKLEIKLKKGADETVLEEHIIPNNWVKDTVAPEIISVRPVSDTSLLVEFSEDVVGADVISNYAVMLDGKYELDISSASYDSETNSVSLIFDDGLYKGEYSIGCKNIFDNSMEQNPVDNVFYYDCEGKLYTDTVFVNGKNVINWWLIIPFVLIALIAVAAFFIIASRRGLIVHERKLMFKDNLVEKERVIVPETTDIYLLMLMADGTSKKIAMKMYKSLIVGRAEMCDLTVDDRAMSRQHFAIEENNGIYTVMNLSSTNGTLLNGVPLSSKIKLENNDVIRAGNVKFVFKRDKF